MVFWQPRFTETKAKARVLKHDFKNGNIPVLVATDIAARGLDIDQLPQVVNFELPNIPEDYVHRIGRTGRAGSSGAAISLVDFEEAKYLKDIEKLIKRDIPKVAVEGFAAPTNIAPEAPRGPRNMPRKMSSNQSQNSPNNSQKNSANKHTNHHANKTPSRNNASANRMDIGSQSIAPKTVQNSSQNHAQNNGQNRSQNTPQVKSQKASYGYNQTANQNKPANGNKPVHHSGNRGK
jgi:ATP-dependent RNA helicase RhlE